MNEGVEKFILRLRGQIEPPRIVHLAGDGNRLARRSAAKGRRRDAIYEVRRLRSPNEVEPRP